MLPTWIIRSNYDHTCYNFMGGLMDKLYRYKDATLSEKIQTMKKDREVCVRPCNMNLFKTKKYEEAHKNISEVMNYILSEEEANYIMSKIGLYETMFIKPLESDNYVVIYIKIEKVKCYLIFAKYLVNIGVYSVNYASN